MRYYPTNDGKILNLSPTKPLRVLIADSHPGFTNELSALVNAEPDMIVVAETSDGEAAVCAAEETRPDLAFIDLHLPRLNGIEVIETIVADLSALNVVAHSLYDDSSFIIGALVAGASGYLLKEHLLAEAIPAARAVLQGQLYLSPVPFCGSLHDVLQTGLISLGGLPARPQSLALNM